jgi:hypothetical protein
MIVCTRVGIGGRLLAGSGQAGLFCCGTPGEGGVAFHVGCGVGVSLLIGFHLLFLGCKFVIKRKKGCLDGG